MNGEIKMDKEQISNSFSHSKFILRLLGLGSSESILYRMYGLSLVIVLTTYIVLSIPEIFKGRQDLDEFIYCMLYEIGYISALITYIYMYCNRLRTEQLFEKLKTLDDLSSCDWGINGYNFMFRYKNLIRKQSYLGNAMAVFGVIICVLVSVTLSVGQEEWVLPFGSGIDLFNNNIKYITNIVTAHMSAIVITTVIFVYANMLAFICAHCQLFQKYLKSIMDCRERNSLQGNQDQNQITNNLQTVNNANDVMDWETFKIKLRKLVPYHVCIYETGAEIENSFCMIVLVWFGWFSTCTCLLLYHLATINVLSMLGIQDLVLILILNFMMMMLSVWGEQVITESIKMASVCYELDFVGTDLRIQKSLLLIMIRAQRPIMPTIGKLKILNLSTMLGVLQSTYSYYTILRNLTRK